MSHITVLAVRPPDSRYDLMKAAWDAITAAGLHPPDELTEYFGGELPEAACALERLSPDSVVDDSSGGCVREYTLPDDVRRIRVVVF